MFSFDGISIQNQGRGISTSEHPDYQLVRFAPRPPTLTLRPVVLSSPTQCLRDRGDIMTVRLWVEVLRDAVIAKSVRLPCLQKLHNLIGPVILSSHTFTD